MNGVLEGVGRKLAVAVVSVLLVGCGTGGGKQLPSADFVPIDEGP